MAHSPEVAVSSLPLGSNSLPYRFFRSPSPFAMFPSPCPCREIISLWYVWYRALLSRPISSAFSLVVLPF